MLFEHLLYSAAVALVIGILFLKYTNKDPSWIIVLMTIAPDADLVFQYIMIYCKDTFGIISPMFIYHGNFHNIFSMIVLSLIASVIFWKFGINFIHAYICSLLGFICHFCEDFVVYPPAYAYFYPFGATEYGINLIPETRNLYVAGSEVLVVGIFLYIMAVMIKLYYSNGNWDVKSYLSDWLIPLSKLKLFIGDKYE